MKAIHTMIGALGLAFVLSAPAAADVNDPEVIIYRFPGVLDDGGPTNDGVATVFHCTNFSGVVETVRFVTRFGTGNIASNLTVTIPHLGTKSASTHPTFAYTVEANLGTGAVGPGAGDPGQGTTAIAATSINVICTAETIYGATAAPVGVSRRGIRFNPVPGSQE